MKPASAAILAVLVAAPWVGAGDPCADPAVEAKAVTAQGLIKQKKFAEAEGPAREALAACPTHPAGIAGLGAALVGQKKNDEAIARLSEAVKAKPDLVYAYLWRGYAYYEKKQPDRMVGDFETFLKLAPSAPEAAVVKQLLASLKR